MNDKQRFHLNTKILIERRKAIKATQSDLSQLLNCSINNISKLEIQEECTLPLFNVLRLSDYLECTPFDLVYKGEYAALSALLRDLYEESDTDSTFNPDPNSQLACTFDKRARIYHPLQKKLKQLFLSDKKNFQLFLAMYQFLTMNEWRQQKTIEYIKMIDSYSLSKSEISEKYLNIISILHNEIDSLRAQLQDAQQQNNITNSSMNN